MLYRSKDMTRHIISKIAGVTAASLMMTAAHTATANDFPDRTITMIVPFAAGGPTDIIARLTAKGLQEKLGETVLVENKSGSGGRLGVNLLKNAKPDGYTIGVATASTQGVAPNLHSTLKNDPNESLLPIGRIVIAPGVLMASKDLGPDCKVDTFPSQLKETPNKHSFGSSGVGGLSHMSGAQFLAVTDTKMRHIPYRGLGPAMIDLQGGRVDAIFDNVSSAMGHIKDGELCPLAVQSDERLDAIPDVPTYDEVDLHDLNTPTWYGLLAPKGTPEDIITTLNESLNEILESEEYKKEYEKLGLQAIPTTPDEFMDIQKAEIELWKGVMEKTGMEKLD